MRVTVRDGRCEGHGLCGVRAPDVYELDDDGTVHVRHDVVPAALQSAAEAGARVCPVSALLVAP